MLKTCFKCGKEKLISDFYPHKGMSDGRLNKCIECTKIDVSNRKNNIMAMPELHEKMKTYARKWYHSNKNKRYIPPPDKKRISMQKYEGKFPEKIRCKSLSQHMTSVNGNLHHWSYNEIHAKDVIDISIKDHLKAHRFLMYDQERKMYRRSDNNELLDTREKHEEWINWCIENKED